MQYYKMIIKKRHIKVAFMDFWTSDYKSLPLYNILSELYDVELCEDGYDYAIFSVFGYRHLDIPSTCISIFYTGENFTPDFNLCDYAIGFDWMEYGDRYLRYPNYYFESDLASVEKRTNSIREINAKQFCSFVVSNGQTAHPLRTRMFEQLSLYKRVNSGGKYMNNIGGPIDDKRAFERQHKFCLTFENSEHSGYTTEKLIDAFAAGCIPIYWGDPDITKVFNPKAFIWVRNETNVNEAIERVKQLDNDDTAYYAMLQEPVFLSKQYKAETMRAELIRFLCNIFDQPIEKAYRYSRNSRPKVYKEELKMMHDALPYRSMRYHIKKWLHLK